MIRSPNLGLGLTLQWVNNLYCKPYKNFSVFFFPLRWDRMATADQSWVFPVPGHLASDNIIPQQVRLWLRGFPWGQALLGRTECSDGLQSGFSPSPPRSRRKVFFWHLLWEFRQAPEGKYNSKVSPLLVTPGVFNPQSCQHWAPTVPPSQLTFFLWSSGSHVVSTLLKRNLQH